MRTGRKRHGNYSDDKNADEVYQPAFKRRSIDVDAATTDYTTRKDLQLSLIK